MLKEQLLDPMVLILIGAALFSALLQEWTEAIVIGTIVVVNAVIGIVQEKKPSPPWKPCETCGRPPPGSSGRGRRAFSPPVSWSRATLSSSGTGDMVPR